jgi:hypothetical protein
LVLSFPDFTDLSIALGQNFVPGFTIPWYYTALHHLLHHICTLKVPPGLNHQYCIGFVHQYVFRVHLQYVTRFPLLNPISGLKP